MRAANSQTAGRPRVGFNMTPMIDVVFLLIIFFLVSSHLARQEVEEELALPTAASADEADDDTSPRVTVNVLADGQLRMAGRRIELHQLQRQLSIENAAQEGNLRLRIRADRHVPYQFVEPILTTCADAGIWNVSFSVLRDQH